MKWSWHIGRFAGVDTYVHASFALLIGWAAWAAYSGAGTALSVFLGVGFLLAVFGSVLLHELGHALTARRYGISTRRIILSPIGGLAQLEGMPANPRQEMAVALAGPAVNFALAGVLWSVGALVGSPLLYGFLGSLMWANLTLGLFNLVPAFPMDGGRALRAFLSMRMPDRNATEIAAFIGKSIAIAMAIVGLFINWLLVAVSAFVWFAADQEVKASRRAAADESLLGPHWMPSAGSAMSWPSVPRAAPSRTWTRVGDEWVARSATRMRVVVITDRP